FNASYQVNTVPDVTLPVITCIPSYTQVPGINCEIVIPDLIALSTTSDNCGIASITQSPVAGSIITGASAGQIITITLTATDISGNTASCSTDIIVGNNQPLAIDDISSTNEDVPVLINVLANDNFGCDGPSAGSITLSSVPLNGTATVDDNGTPLDPTDDQVLYTPNSNFDGIDSFTYTICDSNGDCSTATVTITVIATNDPPVTINESIRLCEGSSYNGTILNGDVDPDGTVLNVITIPLSGPANGLFTTDALGNYSYTPFPGFSGVDQVIVSICDNGIPGVACTNDTIFILVDDNIIANAGIDQNLCDVTSVSLSGNNPIPGTGNWTFVSGPSLVTVSPANSAIATASGLITSATPYIFEYTIVNGTCTSIDQLMIINSSQPSTSFAGTDQALCSVTPASTVMSANTPVSGTGIWTQILGPSVATIVNPSNPNTSITGLIEGTYLFDWTISNGACNPSSSSVMVQISQPASANAGNDDIICETQSSYTLISATASNYQSVIWTSNGTGSFNNSSIINPIYTPSAADIASGTVTLTITSIGNSPCPDVTDQMILTINKQVVVNAGADASICETQSSFALTTASATNYSSLTWSTSGTGSFNNTGIQNPVYTPSAADITAGTVVLTISSSSFAGCANVIDDMTLTISSQALASAGSDINICETQGNISLSTASASDYVSLLWTTSGTGTFNDPTLLNPIYTPGASDIISGTVTLTIQATAIAPCADALDSMVLGISRQATANAGSDAIICETEISVALGASSASNYTSIQWTTSGDGSFSNSSIVNPDYLPGPADLLSGTVTLTLTANSAAPCINVSDAMTLTIIRNVVGSAGPDADACEGTPYTVTGSSASNYSSLLWSHNGLGNLTGASTINPTYTAAAGESGNVILTLKAFSNAPCTDSIVDQMMLDIYPLPTAVLSGGTAVCEGDTAMLTIEFTGTAPWNVTYSNGAASTTISNITASPYLFSVIAPVGSINYTLTALTDSHCAATAAQLSGSALIIVHPTPVTDFTANSACLGDTTYFTVSGSYIMESSHWTWNFGDGTYGVYNTPVNPTHVYPGTGTYTVTLIVQDTIGCSYTVSHNIEIRPLPQAYFNFSTPTCLGTATQFTDLSNNPSGQGYIAEWTWDFGDGSPLQTILFPSTPNISHTYLIAGSYQVTLSVSNSEGCTDTYAQTLTITEVPIADFSYTSNCEDEAAQFFDESITGSTGAVNTWSWNFGDPLSGGSNTSTLQNPLHTYSSPGNYQVTLIVANFNGCTDTVNQQVTINPAPVAEFISSAGCTNNPTYFWADSTIININATATYFWSFGDGNTSNTRNTQNNYTAPGNYTVSLTITDTLGCSATVSHQVNVTIPPAAHFTYEVNNCANEAVTFTDESTSLNGYNTSWHWDFGDGNSQTILFPAIPNTSHTYAINGIFNVTLTVTNSLGCISSETQVINVFGGPEADFYHSGNCSESPVTFTDISTVANPQAIVGWSWNFGDITSGVSNTSTLQNPVHTFANAGTYNVTLVSYTSNGCSDTISHSVLVKPLPQVEFNAIGSCVGSEATFTPDPSVMNINTITTWLWNFGDGITSNVSSPTHIYTTSGTYMVTLTVTDTTGCSNTITHPVIVGEPPVVAFDFSSPGCNQSPVQFTDNTLVPSGYIMRWHWDFGDGNSQTILFPNSSATSHTYANSGTFNVTLTVKTSDSCIALLTRTVTISSRPQAAFSYNSGCEGNTTTFTDNSTVTAALITSWSWNFGDPGSGSSNLSTLQNPVHTYNTAGTYTVQLIAGTNAGCTDTITNTITIAPPPTVDFSSQPGCNGDTTQFNSSSFVNMATTQNWFWQFGDGTTSTLVDPLHIYGAAGTYTVTLTITDNNGCNATITASVNISAAPLANFAIGSPACEDLQVSFTDLTNANGNIITGWSWDFGDGNQISYTTYSPVVNHVYTQAGNFVVTLKVSTQNACENTYQQLISIGAAPLAEYTYQSTCEGESTQFTDLTTTSNGVSIVSWNWNFGEPGSGINNSSNLQNPVHLYATAGQYTVTLISENAYGCTDTVTHQVTISPKPGVEFTHDSITCVEMPVTFQPDPAITNTAAVQSYDWDFGDGSAHSSQPTPTHTYSTVGTYIVTLSIIDTSGCDNSISHEITIGDSPVTAFSYEQSCVEQQTLFTDQSLPPATGSIVSWKWDFGVVGNTNDTSSLQNPAFTYLLPGVYTVTLTTTSASGCSHTKSQPVQIWRNPTANFRYSTTPCSNGAVQFQDSSYSFQATITNWLWEFEPYQYSTLRNPSYSYFQNDTCYDVRLIVTDLHGCMDTITRTVCVPDEFTTEIAHQSACFGTPTTFTPVVLTPSGNQLNSVVWNFGDPLSGSSNTSTQVNASHTFSATGFYTVNMSATDIFGCQSTATTTIEIFALPTASFTWSNSQFSTTVDFTSTSVIAGAAIDYYTWYFGDGTSQTNYAPVQTASHSYAQAGYYTVTLLVVDKNGCTSTFSQEILCSPSPQAAMEVTDTLICQNTAITIENRSSGSIDTWIWNWGDGTAPTVNTTFQPTISHTYSQPGTFLLSLKIITLYNGNPIADSTTRIIHVNPSPEAGFVANKHCLGEMTMFTDTTLTHGAGGLTYTWNFGDPISVSDSSSAANPGYVYSSAGLFDANLIVANQYGCSDTVTQPIKVNGLPTAQFDHSVACLNNPTYFFEHSQEFEESLIHWGWRIGNEKIVGWMNGPSPSFTFDSVGVYPILMTVTDANGCIDTTAQTVTVYPSPYSAFSIEENYENEQGHLLLNNGSLGGSEYNWILGNGETSTETSPVVEYTEDGRYEIILYTTNEYGCTDSTSFAYDLLFKGLYIPNAFSPNGPEQTTRYWKPVGVNLAYYKVEIFNRWDELIWTSTALDEKGAPVEGWDGSFKDSPCQQGTYVWKITAIYRDGSIWQNRDLGDRTNLHNSTSGTVTIIR
ncbi:MAG: PKD domain-containing protein, partial [Bacteroidales bacterium]|nr:PKD domain-containing protein [Bacteroidales bacterium]